MNLGVIQWVLWPRGLKENGKPQSKFSCFAAISTSICYVVAEKPKHISCISIHNYYLHFHFDATNCEWFGYRGVTATAGSWEEIRNKSLGKKKQEKNRTEQNILNRCGVHIWLEPFTKSNFTSMYSLNCSPIEFLSLYVSVCVSSMPEWKVKILKWDHQQPIIFV